jgi:hypothetical protein
MAYFQPLQFPFATQYPPQFAMPVPMQYQPPSGLPQSWPPMGQQQMQVLPPLPPMAPEKMMPAQHFVQAAAQVASPPVATMKSKQVRHAALAKTLRKPPQKGSAKKGQEERQYGLSEFQCMLRELLTSSAGPKTIAADHGFPSAASSLGRYAKDIRRNARFARATPEETLAAQLDFVDQLEFKQKGHEEIKLRKLFTEDEKDVFARALMLYGDMGWGLDYQNIRVMFAEAAAKAGRIDWKTGEPHVVSHAYVAEFVKNRPELHAYKVSHVDPLRSKKATAKVCACCLCPEGCLLMSGAGRAVRGIGSRAPGTPLLLLFSPCWGNSGRFLNSTPGSQGRAFDTQRRTLHSETHTDPC